jgi:hypothetical protein
MKATKCVFEIFSHTNTKEIHAVLLSGPYKQLMHEL